eukprot:Selendium_serpulae@DN1943_c0_g1_i3.p1
MPLLVQFVSKDKSHLTGRRPGAHSLASGRLTCLSMLPVCLSIEAATRRRAGEPRYGRRLSVRLHVGQSAETSHCGSCRLMHAEMLVRSSPARCSAFLCRSRVFPPYFSISTLVQKFVFLFHASALK